MKNSILLFLLTAIIVLNSCEKEDEKSKTDLLCGKFWKTTELTVDPSFPIGDDYGNITGYTNDLFAQLESCDKDDVQKYNSDGTYTFDTKSKCYTDEVQTTSGTWIWNSDETVITEKEDGESYSYTVLELTDDKLKIRYDTDLDGTTYKFTATMIPE